MKRINLLRSLLVIFLTLNVQAISAHDFGELDSPLSIEQELTLLSVTQQLLTKTEPPLSEEFNQADSFSERLFLRVRLYEEVGEEALLQLLESSPLKDVFEPAPYVFFVEALGQLLHVYKHEQTSEKDDGANLDVAVIKAIRDLEQGVNQ